MNLNEFGGLRLKFTLAVPWKFGFQLIWKFRLGVWMLQLCPPGHRSGRAGRAPPSPLHVGGFWSRPGVRRLRAPGARPAPQGSARLSFEGGRCRFCDTPFPYSCCAALLAASSSWARTSTCPPGSPPSPSIVGGFVPGRECAGSAPRCPVHAPRGIARLPFGNGVV